MGLKWQTTRDYLKIIFFEAISAKLSRTGNYLENLQGNIVIVKMKFSVDFS
jgi:hypothetical protein